MKKRQTISDILNSSKVGDFISDGKREWKVVDKDYDGCVVAIPIKGCDFELWSKGPEEISFVEGLKVVKKEKN